MARDQKRNFKDDLKIGDRIVHQQFPSMKDRFGTIVRFTKAGNPVVHWDRTSLISPVFTAFEKVEEKGT